MAEQRIDKPEDHEGEKYLNLLELGHIADEDFQLSEEQLQSLAAKNIVVAGGVIKGRDFLDVCREDALQVLVAYEHMDKGTPEAQEFLSGVQEGIMSYLEPPSEG